MVKKIAEHEIKFLLTAKNLTKKSFDKILSTLPTMGDLAKVTAKAVAGIGVAAVAASTASVIAFSNFETALTDMTRVTNNSLNEIKETMLELPPELGGATELVKGYYNVISAGVTRPAESLELLTTAAKASNSAHLELDTTVAGITNLMDGFGGSIESAAVASDKLFTIERIGKTRFSELAPVIGQVASSANILGVSLDELGGLFATVTKTAGGTETAGTQVKAIFNSLLRPSSEMTRVLDDMGFATARSAIESRTLAGVLHALNEEVNSGGTSMQELFKNQRALNGIAPALQNNLQILGDNIDEMAMSTGATDKAFDAWSGTLEGVWKTFKNTIGNLAIEFGEILAPTIKQALIDITFYIQDNKGVVLDWARSFGENIEDIKLYLKDNETVIFGWMGDFGDAMLSVKAAWVEVSEYMKIWVKNYNQTVRPVIDSIVDSIMAVVEALQKVWQAFSDTDLKASPGLMRYITDQTDEIKKQTKETIDEISNTPIDINVNTKPAETAVEYIKSDLLNEIPKETTVEVLGENEKAIAAIEDVNIHLNEMPKETTVEVLGENEKALMAIEAVNDSMAATPKEMTIETLVENINALASLQAVNDSMAATPKEIESAVNIATAAAHTALDSVQRHIALIPDVTVKTLLMKVETEASPRRPFTEGMKYIKDKIEALPYRRGLIIDTDIPAAGGRGEPHILLSSAGGSSTPFMPGLNNRPETTNNNLTQNIDVTVNITTQDINNDNIETFTDQIAESLARKLDTGRASTFRQALRRI